MNRKKKLDRDMNAELLTAREQFAARFMASLMRHDPPIHPEQVRVFAAYANIAVFAADKLIEALNRTALCPACGRTPTGGEECGPCAASQESHLKLLKPE
ncbi:MAG TPA: hypothetical protein VM529_15950 [Gemmata sp.]|jgi:hypothetical protein|nr:hypothetical protein [Gemmata sp.]